MKKISIAIDGPSASGKSSVAKIIAKKLNYVYIDTGAMYRCVGYYCLQNNIDLKDEQAVINVLDDIKITMDSSNNVYLNDVNVSNQIRQDKVSMSASEVSKYQEVRDFLVKQQRDMAKIGGVILDGRDIGTVVLPNAELKIYETLKKEIEERDYQDMNRKISPLKKADDAILLDTSDLQVEEVVDEILKLVEQKIKEG